MSRVSGVDAAEEHPDATSGTAPNAQPITTARRRNRQKNAPHMPKKCAAPTDARGQPIDHAAGEKHHSATDIAWRPPRARDRGDAIGHAADDRQRAANPRNS
jgi:hypothetical protein